ncbi:hypothetical protein IC582_026125 [Cucumis melo]|uniref:Early nodulin-like protein 1 n=3 Tax=Cucumis melo TaxID=3656 RepID=A0A1S3BJD3_CUCME|nr:early nodulin-like protein 1 [Cucumis melo]
MGFGRLIIVGLVSVMGLAMVCSCEARKFYVGGKDGWGLNPSESFNHWAERNRFQVNDTLYFKYKNETESVLVVSKEDYFSCNTKNPVISLKENNGESVFKFGHSGPFYFISENGDSCQKGQKLIVVVLALTHNKHHQAQSQPPHSSFPPVAPPSQSLSPTAESPEKSGTAPAPAKSSASGRGGVAFSLLGVAMINVVVLLV